jgi:hypothetical protein
MRFQSLQALDCKTAGVRLKTELQLKRYDVLKFVRARL